MTRAISVASEQEKLLTGGAERKPERPTEGEVFLDERKHGRRGDHGRTSGHGRATSRRRGRSTVV